MKKLFLAIISVFLVNSLYSVPIFAAACTPLSTVTGGLCGNVGMITCGDQITCCENTLSCPGQPTGSRPNSCMPLSVISGGMCSSEGMSLCGDQITCCTDTADCQNGNTNTSTNTSTSGNPLCSDGISVNTAIGCLTAGDPKILISQLLGWGVVVGIGIAFLMIIFAGFQIATASGDPKRVKAAQELITSAISGLLLIVFSILLLNFIGFQLLRLPGFKI